MVTLILIIKKIFPPLLFCIVLLSCGDLNYFSSLESRFDWHRDVRLERPDPPLGENYSFIVVSDTHITNLNDAQRFSGIKDSLINTDLFIVVNGDITEHGGARELRYFLEAAKDIGEFALTNFGYKIPLYPVIGNHDVYTDEARAWKELIGATVYRVDSSGTSLFILDNASGFFGFNQLDWLERELRSAGKNTFVFAHTNLESMLDIREWGRLRALLKGRCKIMFIGHVHNQYTREIDGVRYFHLKNFGSRGDFYRVHVEGQAITIEPRSL